MKRKLLALILAMALGLTACGGGDAASQDDAAEEQPDAVQIEEPEVQTANYTVVESQPYSEGHGQGGQGALLHPGRGRRNHPL